MFNIFVDVDSCVATFVRCFLGMLGLTVLCSAYNIIIHEHPHRGKELPYMKLRHKPYPWVECPDCNIFDGDCWDSCRGKEVAHH